MNLVIGAIVGADIYIAAAFGAGLLGPAADTCLGYSGINGYYHSFMLR
jgi:APA family basic amino acid/polyamine antiporter